jgi:hypothetical protein
MVPAVRHEDPQPPVEGVVQRQSRLGPRLRQPDVDERSSMAEHREALGDGLGPADDVEDEVEPLRLLRPGVGGAEPLGGLELPFVEVKRVDLGRTCDPRPLDHAEADRATADHGHARALPDLGRLQHRADARGDRAAEQAGLFGGQIHGQPDQRSAVQHAPRSERPGAEHPHQVTAVTRMHPPGGNRRRAAQVPGAAQAPAALAAG